MIRDNPILDKSVLSLKRTALFSVRVLRAFFKNHGVLLAGGVGYNVLLSMVPLFALLCVLLTHIVDEQTLLAVVAVQAEHLAPANADLVHDAVQQLLSSRDVIGGIGLLALTFFSSFAFRMLEDSIAIIFHQPDITWRRSFWVSAALPYAFMIVLGTALLALTMMIALVSGTYDFFIVWFNIEPEVGQLAEAALNVFGFLGMVFLFSAIYKVLPVVKIATRRAIVGGLVAAVLWEGIRLLVTYYFANISFVNAVYGSLATLVILLLTLEIGAFILLLGAQVIAELERSAKADLPWYEAPNAVVPLEPD